MVLRPLRRPLGWLLLPLTLSCAGPLAAADTPPAGEPAAGAAPAAAESQAAPAAGSADTARPTASPTTPPTTTPAGPSSREQQVLERIRQLKTPRWRSFGACRYDWSGWRLSDAGVRATASECGEPPVASGVAVHCESLRIARRNGDGPWEPWRLPLASDESKTLGGEDRMVASLCANVTAPVAPSGSQAAPPHPLKAPPAAPAGGGKNGSKSP